MSNITPLGHPAPTTQVVDTRYTQDVIPILDTSKFEHMQRIAMAMAIGSTIPETLRRGKVNGQEIDYPENVVVANCFRVVNQAVRWGMDPFAVMDCVSLVHGKMMYEGKLISAVLDSKLGVDLDYVFHDEDKGQKLRVVVSGTKPGQTKVRTVEGTVENWHKGAKSPWANPADWKRQLIYRGAREWARLHAPAILLGVYSDDEFDAMRERDVPTGQRAMRMRDITPAKAIEPPDPDTIDPPAVDDVPTVDARADEAAPEDDAPIADEAGLIEQIKESIAACDGDEAAIAEVWEANESLVARLSRARRAEAEALFQT